MTSEEYGTGASREPASPDWLERDTQELISKLNPNGGTDIPARNQLSSMTWTPTAWVTI